MGLKITIKTNLDLKSAIRKVKNPAMLMAQISDVRRYSFHEAIASGRTPSGGRVAALTPAYSKYKAKKWGSRPIRVASGSTLGSYKSTVSGTKLIETVSSVAAPFLQNGTGKMVARPLLPKSWDDMGEQDRSHIIKLSTEFLESVLEGIGTASRGQSGNG